jgi:acyl carrier protein phosphodiesterase
MNFLAHLVLAGDDEDLRLGAMLGDFVKGRAALSRYHAGLRTGILLHRHIDSFVDGLPAMAELRSALTPEFRRYGGIIIDLILDHELARDRERWQRQSLEAFDGDVRDMLASHDELLPERLRHFMRYADRRGLFCAYRQKSEILHSLWGIGRRLSRPNPLHRVEVIWDSFEPRVAARYGGVFDSVQFEVAAWLKTKSTMTGS